MAACEKPKRGLWPGSISGMSEEANNNPAKSRKEPCYWRKTRASFWRGGGNKQSALWLKTPLFSGESALAASKSLRRRRKAALAKKQDAGYKAAPRSLLWRNIENQKL